MSDPLDIVAAKVTTPLHVSSDTAFEPDLFFDGDRFMAYLNRTYEEFDVLTYSMSKAGYGFPLKRINRLVHGLRSGISIRLARPKEHKFVMNNHIKMFICHKGTEVDIYVGSQNLTYGTNMNLMYRVRPEHVKPLLEFFEKLWRSA